MTVQKSVDKKAGKKKEINKIFKKNKKTKKQQQQQQQQQKTPLLFLLFTLVHEDLDDFEVILTDCWDVFSLKWGVGATRGVMVIKSAFLAYH